MRSKINNLEILNYCEFIDQYLSQYYAVANTPHIKDYIFLNKDNECSQVTLFQKNNELNLAIDFCHKDYLSLQKNNFFSQLNLSNLNLFWLLVEEISHFRLLITRAVADLKVSKLQLEFQAEIDKILLTYLFLDKQRTKPSLSKLCELSFSRCVLLPAHSSEFFLYEEASRWASVFWYNAKLAGLGRDWFMDSYPFQALLRKIYRSSFSDINFHLSRLRRLKG